LHQQTPPVIHRDVKPANIKIDKEGKAVLVDFGVAKIWDPNQRTTQELVLLHRDFHRLNNMDRHLLMPAVIFML
jgi:serine/threonine protein kinase